MQNNKNILIATILSTLILLSWTWFYEKPRLEKQEAAKKAVAQTMPVAEVSKLDNAKAPEARTLEKVAAKTQEVALTLKNREDILNKSNLARVKIESENLHGSISLVGARFDDLTLAKYFVQADKKQEVILFAPSESKERYFTDFGWISSDASLDLPKPSSVWKTSANKLTPKNPVTLSWRNKTGIEFLIHVNLDENFMFNVSQEVKNGSGKEISVASYGRINRVLNNAQKAVYILHEGPIGVLDGALKEATYEDLIEEKKHEFSSSEGGWLGITDKYWLSSIIPDANLKYAASFNYDLNNQNSLYTSEFIGQEFKINKGEVLKFDHHLFAGAKKVALLDQYSKEYNIKLFDRAIDFGWFYFLTKPFYFIISFLNKFLGNFGLAILAMTVLIKLALFPMANKSYAAIGKVKLLQPKIDAIRERLKGDKMAMNREIMEFYKKEKVNPASGCLPILVQIPVFFALYKVIYVTLEMRHAPFYGWIHDLSAPDPTSIFNLFGLLPFHVSSAFTIGVWPILMGITMILQQKLSPTTSDPTQAKILKWMPFVLTFVLAAFPAGLVIYWTWSNALSILQQWVISRKLSKASK
jgi:YidC/Oxa1 family membrane protein insertase